MLDAVSGALATREAPSATRYPDPSTAHLLSPKWLTARARGRSTERGSNVRVAFLAVFGFGFWAVIFAALFRLLRYFRGVQDIGPLLAGKLLGLILVGFFSILMLSNIITALSSFFLARDLDLLASAPVDWFKFYVAKLIETLIHSSWMVLLLAIPIFTAYGVVYSGGPFFPHRANGAGEKAECAAGPLEVRQSGPGGRRGCDDAC